MAVSGTVVFNERALAALFTSDDGPTAKHLARLALRVEREAKHLCPVDTGRLRSSITHALAHDSRGLLAVVGTNVEYAAYVEFGTRFMAAQPYLRPALHSVTAA